MAKGKSKTAKRREQSTSLIQQRTVVLPLSLEEDQYDLLERAARHMWGVKRRYAHNRKTLQEKGTRSAHRRLKAMKGREERFIRDVNHCASKQLANTPGVRIIAFEDLAYIRRMGRRNTKGGKRRRNMLNQWPFSQLQEFTAYKAARNGIVILMIDPSYTSRRCHRCGYVDRRNRNHARFDCLRCGWSDNADRNAALNIRDRAIASLEQEHTSTDRPVDRVPSTTRMDGTPATTCVSNHSRITGATLTSKPRCSSSR
ncbi:RNA-guided endonuclease TnpB family protein [Bifidobacterium sp. SO1]|uniref:RNA-guided endonuclease InsQ/TnpB family protein n=1 Tax=Bifidobacterium sp. SO1 TaxID=2809029 RepID=UPI001BDC72DE|nr:RNA-guided endonuclease TnpB family protein [Bifidobacterium sp. SO1]MBT1161828.1 transposase [Bifidobacterium sp. SO1]